MGHVLNYTLGDVVSHVRRRNGLVGAAPDGLRRLRPARRERRDPRGRPPARGHRAEHRRDPHPDPADGLVDRLDARGLDPRARVLPLDAVALPEAVRGGPRLPQGGAGEVVPARPDRARERAGDRRPLRALRHRGRGAQPRAVDVQDHRLRRPAARRHGAARLARARADDAAQLDRPLGGRRGDLPGRGARRGRPRLHDAARTRSSARRSSCSRPSIRSSSGFAAIAVEPTELREYVRHAAGEEERGARRRRREDRRLHGLLCGEPGERRAASRSGSPTTC